MYCPLGQIPNTLSSILYIIFLINLYILVHIIQTLSISYIFLLLCFIIFISTNIAENVIVEFSNVNQLLLIFYIY